MIDFQVLQKIKRAREKKKLKESSDIDDNKISREVSIPDVITVQDLALGWQKKLLMLLKH